MLTNTVHATLGFEDTLDKSIQQDVLDKWKGTCGTTTPSVGCNSCVVLLAVSRLWLCHFRERRCGGESVRDPLP